MDNVSVQPTNFFNEQSQPRNAQQANTVPVTTQEESSDGDGFSNDYQSFLRLLVAQMEHQDPMDPTDPTQFMSQLAQFSTVEQQIKTNSNLENMMSHLDMSVDRLDLAYLGRDVEAISNTIGLKEDNPVRFSYTLGDNVEQSDIHVIDQYGEVVHSMPGELTAGEHEVVWDGKDTSGQPLTDGVYSIQIVAKDADDNAVESNVSIVDKVKEVAKIDGQTWLILESGNRIPPEMVTKVSDPFVDTGPPSNEEST